jgi:hypothetical protein
VSFNPEEYLKRFTYKPGWGFTVCQDWSYPGGLILHIQTESRPDANNPNDRNRWNPVQTTARMHFPRDMSPKQMESAFRGQLLQAIRALELHEMDEWLRFDGEHVNDPHPEIPKLKPKLVVYDEASSIPDAHYADALRYMGLYAAR